MALFGNREEKKQQKEDKKQEKLEQLMAGYNLDDLSQEDKEYARMVIKSLSGTTLIGLGSNAQDMAKIGLSQTIVDQNFLIIKLLNEINQKLDK